MKLHGRFGRFGGAYVPEILVPALELFENAFLEAQHDEAFQAELADLLSTYAGRPTPLTRCRNLGRGRARIYLKREDLLHGGAHKTNQALGQGLLAKRLGKRRLIAETGAGQHGVATALTGAVLGLEDLVALTPVGWRSELAGRDGSQAVLAMVEGTGEQAARAGAAASMAR